MVDCFISPASFSQKEQKVTFNLQIMQIPNGKWSEPGVQSGSISYLRREMVCSQCNDKSQIKRKISCQFQSKCFSSLSFSTFRRILNMHINLFVLWKCWSFKFYIQCSYVRLALYLQYTFRQIEVLKKTYSFFFCFAHFFKYLKSFSLIMPWSRD